MLRLGRDVLDHSLRAPGLARLFDPPCRADPRLQASAVRFAVSVAQHMRAIGAFSQFPFFFHSAGRDACRSACDQRRAPNFTPADIERSLIDRVDDHEGMNTATIVADASCDHAGICSAKHES